jgi:hypothetical protein
MAHRHHDRALFTRPKSRGSYIDTVVVNNGRRGDVARTDIKRPNRCGGLSEGEGGEEREQGEGQQRDPHASLTPLLLE